MGWAEYTKSSVAVGAVSAKDVAMSKGCSIAAQLAVGAGGAKDMANGSAVRASSAGPPGARAAMGGPSPPSAAGKGPGIMHPNPAVRAEARYIERVRTICGILNIGAAQVRPGVRAHVCVCVRVRSSACMHLCSHANMLLSIQ
eukprot:scaffold101860_cov21-Tisochrysis_lutea.AAC.1